MTRAHFFFFFNDTATTEIYTLSLHDALPISSLLDEGTAAAEAMHLTEAVAKHEGQLVYLIDANCHPQTIAVVRTRAAARGLEIVVTDPANFDFQHGNVIGALVQYPATDGAIRDYR